MQTIYLKSAPPVRILFVSDLHWAARHRAAWALFEHFRRHYDPQHLICLGDLVDFAGVSRFTNVAREPDGRLRTPDPDELPEEIHAAGSVLARWRREHPGILIDFVEGNHEARLQTFIATSARPALGLTNLVDQWRLGALDIRFTAYGQGRLLPYGRRGLWITHGSKAGARPASGELALWNRPGISGHVHKRDAATRRVAGDGWETWTSIPCLCTLDPAGAWVRNPAWELGWTIGSYWPETQELALETLLVQENTVTWREHTWTAQG